MQVTSVSRYPPILMFEPNPICLWNMTDPTQPVETMEKNCGVEPSVARLQTGAGAETEAMTLGIGNQ